MPTSPGGRTVSRAKPGKQEQAETAPRRPGQHADLSVYEDRQFIGSIRRLFTRRFLAIDPNGKRLGIHATERAAMRALPRITGTATNKTKRPPPDERSRAREKISERDDLSEQLRT